MYIITWHDKQGSYTLSGSPQSVMVAYHSIIAAAWNSGVTVRQADTGTVVPM